MNIIKLGFSTWRPLGFGGCLYGGSSGCFGLFGQIPFLFSAILAKGFETT